MAPEFAQNIAKRQAIGGRKRVGRRIIEESFLDIISPQRR
jgi:hypothetical protein